VKHANECAIKLTKLLKKLPDAEPPELPDSDDPVAVLVLSFLMAESSTERAVAAYAKLRDRIVDFNDLRVSMGHEMSGYLGSRYPLSLERSERLRATLRNIYLREHCVKLDRLNTGSKRDVRKYLESLEGMMPYAAARVMLLAFDAHAIPVDEQLRSQLVAAGAADESASAGEISVWISRQIKAGDRLPVHFKLQAWIDEVGAHDGSKAKTAKKGKTKRTAGDKSARKTTTKSGRKTTTKKKAAGSAGR
jgi:endonuclease III